MKLQRKKLTLVLIALLVTAMAYSQPNAKAKRMEIFMQVSPTDTTSLFGDTLFKQNTKLMATMFIVLKDTLDLSSFHVKFGTTPGNNNLLHKTFQFDSFGNFSDGTSYSRKRNIVRLGLGEFTGLNSYSAELMIEDRNAQLLPAIVYTK